MPRVQRTTVLGEPPVAELLPRVWETHIPQTEIWGVGGGRKECVDRNEGVK